MHGRPMSHLANEQLLLTDTCIPRPYGSYYFPVNVRESRLAERNGVQGPHWLRITQDGMALLDQTNWEPQVTVPVQHMRR